VLVQLHVSGDSITINTASGYLAPGSKDVRFRTKRILLGCPYGPVNLKLETMALNTEFNTQPSGELIAEIAPRFLPSSWNTMK
jgi:hypothetical protein